MAPCRQISTEIEFRQAGRLARGRVSEKHPSKVRAGPPLRVGAKASHSKVQKSSANLELHLLHTIFSITWSTCRYIWLRADYTQL